MTSSVLDIYTDGGARGNPGPAAIGVVIRNGKRILHEFGKTIGSTTNNVAEYTAVIEALTYLKNTKSIHTKIIFHIDSTLVVNQLNGIYKIKNSDLRLLIFTIKNLEQEVGGEITYISIPREQNARADFLVNSSLDS